MVSIARVEVPGLAHHITQRGNRLQEIFFIDDDYQEYLHLMAEWCIRCKVEVWSYFGFAYIKLDNVTMCVIKLL